MESNVASRRARLFEHLRTANVPESQTDLLGQGVRIKPTTRAQLDDLRDMATRSLRQRG